MNERVFDVFGVGPDSPQWLDWQWQYAHRVADAGTLSRIVDLSAREKEEIERCLGSFRMAVTPYFASLMDPADPRCPIRMQTVPSAAEARVYPWESQDPLCEESSSPVPGIVHRYPDRVLFLVTRQCAAYCRHCVRRRHVGEEDYTLGPKEREAALRYISGNSRVRDVLLSGGDPLMLGDGALEEILSGLRAIEHVEVIRIGTRAPSALPMRVTPELLNMLRKYHPLWINTQFNHPRELTADVTRACIAIADAGIPLGNQSVLLRGINDRADTMKELLLGLVRMRVRPYYLYQCDLNEGLGHFRTPVETGIDIIRELTGSISGFAVPKFVIDAPGGGGKVPIQPEYVVSMDGGEVVMRNYEGKLYTYPQAKR